MNKPKYPIYIPSKNRYDPCHTARFFLDDGVEFKIVVEPSQAKKYAQKWGIEQLLILPEDGLKLLGSRLWIRDHSIANGFDRHWQFDDNISYIMRLHKGKRIRCNANIAISQIEDFTDRYENIGVSGFNYTMFVLNHENKPFTINSKVYSGSLINNRMPYKWRLYYNDDTDLCLQCLMNGLCTVEFNAFNIQKLRTMTVGGGNTTDLYQKDGRLIMARALEEVWKESGLVKTVWKFGRPQHQVDWRPFRGLKLKRRADINWGEIESKKFDIPLIQKAEIKSEELKRFFAEANSRQ